MREDGGTVTVRVPMTFCRRGGRKAVITPKSAGEWAPRPRVDNTLIKALARAYRWKRMLESGEYANFSEIAEAEKIGESYIGRVLRLTLLAPDIVEMILNGRHRADLQLHELMHRFPTEWSEQRCALRAQ